MDINVNVKFSGSPDFLAALQGFFKGGAPAINGTPVKNLPKKKEESSPAEPAEDGAITVEALRDAVTKKAQAGKKAAIKKLLKEFGTDSVSNLEEAKYADFMEKLETL